MCCRLSPLTYTRVDCSIQYIFILLVVMYECVGVHVSFTNKIFKLRKYQFDESKNRTIIIKFIFHFLLLLKSRAFDLVLMEWGKQLWQFKVFFPQNNNYFLFLFHLSKEKEFFWWKLSVFETEIIGDRFDYTKIQWNMQQSKGKSQKIIDISHGCTMYKYSAWECNILCIRNNCIIRKWFK